MYFAPQHPEVLGAKYDSNPGFRRLTLFNVRLGFQVVGGAADVVELELVPYGCAKVFKVSMFPHVSA